MVPVESGQRVVCHGCGEALTAISTQHARRHGLSLVEFRLRFGLNRKQSLLAPVLAEKRRVEGQRRWAENAAVRDGMAVGQQMARDGTLYELGAAAQPAGTRRSQDRSAASRDGASPALRADCERRSSAARARWAERARALGVVDMESYLVERRAAGASAHRVRTELGCGGSTAARLLTQGDIGS